MSGHKIAIMLLLGGALLVVFQQAIVWGVGQ